VDIRRLEVFCKVVELKSFTRAAEVVLLSQPSVSEHVRLLEEAVGEKLLDRLGREVLPTGAGQILYRYARRIIRLRDEAVQAIGEYRGSLSGVFPVGASTIPGAYILPPLIETFRSEHPSIRVMLKISGTTAIVEELLQGEIELAIVGAHFDDPRLHSSPFFSDELFLVAHAGHPWASSGTVSLDSLEGQPFIVREKGSGTRIVMNEVLERSGFDPERLSVIAEMGSTEAVRQGVKARLGLSILSSLAVDEDIRRGSLVRIHIGEVRFDRHFYLVQRKNRQLSPIAETFLAHLLARKH